MKERELREHADCDYCQKPIGHCGIPAFYTVELKQYSLDAGALQRQTGLAMHMGSAALAMVMGADEDMANETMCEKLTMCWNCWAEKFPQPEPEEDVPE